MADLLSPTNPVPGRDSNIINRTIPLSPNDTRIQNAPDLTRVVRSDGRTEQQDHGDAAQSATPRFDSNYQTFLQRLRDMPDMLENMTKFLLSSSGMVVTSGLSEGLALEMSQLLEMLRMDESGIAKFLEGQLKGGTRFGGALFSLLRAAYSGTHSGAMRDDILQFLKKYNDFSSTQHIEGNLLREMRGMIRSIPASWGARLSELAAKLENGLAAGDREGNLKLLQSELLPFMSNYIENTRDMGHARSLLTMMVLDLARYENGSEQSVLQAFHQLLGYGSLKEKFEGLDDAALLRLLRESTFAKAAHKDGFAEKLAETAVRALRGEGGAEAQTAFREIVSAMLINESVYMPLNHMFIPIEWNGKMMFSEMWVDPDDKGQSDSSQEGSGVRVLFKMDIEDIGLFDVVLGCKQNKVDLRVACPASVEPFIEIIQRELTRILTVNGLQVENVMVGKMEKPLTISEVFPKILEGRNSVDVKV